MRRKSDYVYCFGIEAVTEIEIRFMKSELKKIFHYEQQQMKKETVLEYSLKPEK